MLPSLSSVVGQRGRMDLLRWLPAVIPLLVLGHQGCPVLGAAASDTDANRVKIIPYPSGEEALPLSGCHEVPAQDCMHLLIGSKQSCGPSKDLVHTQSPVEYAVVRDGGKRCASYEQCVGLLEGMSPSKSHKRPCELLENFYIGDDGHVYEGRGWHAASYWNMRGLEKNSVTVQFLGSYQSEMPSAKALKAFQTMFELGKWAGKVSSHYHVLSMRQVRNDSSLVGDTLDTAVRSWNRWTELSAIKTWELIPSAPPSWVFRSEWGASEVPKTIQRLTNAVTTVYILEGGVRCHTADECIERIKSEHSKAFSNYGDVLDNFYVGDDGNIYEGRGFNFAPAWNIKSQDSRYITVHLFGKFEAELPSDAMLHALKILVRTGVHLERIEQNYSIHSLRNIYDDKQLLGDKLYEYAQGWNPWATHLKGWSLEEEDESDQLLPVFDRNDWGAMYPDKAIEELRRPVDYVMVSDGGESCHRSKECLSLMKKKEKMYMEDYGDLLDNFYIGGDGNAYHGRGWTSEPHWQFKYFNHSLIAVNFLGTHETDGPSTLAILAFKSLIKNGIKQGNISPNYQLFSIREIYEDRYFLGDKMKEYMETTEKWSTNLSTLPESDRESMGLLPFISRGDWEAKKADKTFHQYTNPVEFVIVGEAGDICFMHQECLSRIQTAQSDNMTTYGDVPDSFYIGGDGNAYEGRGWKLAPCFFSEGMRGDILQINFFGNHKDSLPSKLAMLAFHRLLKNGVMTGKLSEKYKIVAIRQLMDNEEVMSRNFYNNVKTWDRWTQKLDFISDAELNPSKHSLFVTRDDWHAEDPSKTAKAATHPLKYVILHEEGDYCATLESCVASISAVQKHSSPNRGDLSDNFYIGDGGQVFEGRGWDVSSYFVSKGFESSAMSVGFLGMFHENPPSQAAISALRLLLSVGVRYGKLDHNYEIMSFAQIYNNSIVGDKLSEIFNGTEHFSTGSKLPYDKFRILSLSQPIVLKEEWETEIEVRKVSSLRHPLMYLVVRDGGDRCFTNDECYERISKEHKEQNQAGNGGVTENFYIGDDGCMYEGTGWDWDTKWGFSGWERSATVHFFGSYETKPPSAKALEAFETIIVKLGIETGKLSPEYKVVALPESTGITIGEKLKEDLKTWKNWAESIS